MESQPQNPEFRINPENFHPCNENQHNIINNNQPTHEILVLITCRSIQCSGKSVHLRRLTRVFAVCLHKVWM